MAENSGQAPANGKRAKISKAQQITMLEVLCASLVLGACLVLSIFMIKYIKFNTQVIKAKNDAISEYDKTIRNVGVCVDKDGDGRLSDEELKNCNPSSLSLENVRNSLRYNVLMTMANNTNLESVGRSRTKSCYDESGAKIDFNKMYEQSTDDTERQQYLQSAKICSALRVIPDALPAQKNTEALMSSLNQIFIEKQWDPERLSPRDDIVRTNIEGIATIPVNLSFEGSDQVVLNVLDGLERSIREFDITSATVEWTNSGLSFRASANAFYLEELPEIERIKTVYASRKARRTNSGSTGESKVDAANDMKNSLTEDK